MCVFTRAHGDETVSGRTGDGPTSCASLGQRENSHYKWQNWRRTNIATSIHERIQHFVRDLREDPRQNMEMSCRHNINS